MKSIVVLVSGNGTNLQAIIDACETSISDGKVTAVFSNKATAYGLERAKKAGAAAVFVDPKAFETRDAFDHALMQQIDEYQPDLIVLAGYMRILSGEFVRHYMGDEEHGTMVHFVTEKLDGGPGILQASVPIYDEDTVDSLTKRVQEQEYRIYPLVTQWFVEGRLEMKEGKAYLDGNPLGIHGHPDQ